MSTVATHAPIDVRAAVVDERDTKTFTVKNVRLRAPLPDEVIVDVMASSLCHSDWTFIEFDHGNPFPALFGHELAGVVREVGDQVTHVKPGDHVVASLVGSCGSCLPCQRGELAWCVRPDLVRRPERISVGKDDVWQFGGVGGFAEVAVMHMSQVVAVDPRIPFDRAAILGCAVVTGAGAVMRVAKTKPGAAVAIFGAGGVGLCAAQAAALSGARTVIMVDISDEKLALAKRFGATHVVNGAYEDVVATIMDITSGGGIDHVFEVTGLPGPLQQGYDILAPQGTVYLVGMQKPGSTFEFPTAQLMRGAGIRSVRMGSTNIQVDIPFYAELYLQGRFNLDDLVARTITLDEINEGYADMLAGATAGRTVIDLSAAHPTYPAIPEPE